MKRSKPWRRIRREEAVGASATFVLAHLECGTAVEIHGGNWSLLCWCTHCEDLRTYHLVEEDKLEH